MEPQFFEDFAVGQRYRSSSRQITLDEITRFASEFDPQPFHLDEAAAAETMFGGLAASGWHTAALTMKLLVGSEFSPAGGIIGMGFDELRWPRPVRPGDELHTDVEVLEVRTSKSNASRGLVKIRTTTLNQQGEAVQVSVGTVLVPRRT